MTSLGKRIVSIVEYASLRSFLFTFAVTIRGICSYFGWNYYGFAVRDDVQTGGMYMNSIRVVDNARLSTYSVLICIEVVI